MNEAPDGESAHPASDGAPQTATSDRMPAERRLRRLLVAVVVPLVGATAAMLAVLWPPPLQAAESAGQMAGVMQAKPATLARIYDYLLGGTRYFPGRPDSGRGPSRHDRFSSAQHASPQPQVST